MMVLEDYKQLIVNKAVEYFLENNDKISYKLINDLFNGKIYKDELTTAALLAAVVTIVHNIPRKNEKTGNFGLRPYEECYNGSITFWKSNVQEKLIVKLTNENTMIDLVSGRVLPPLSFNNNNHDFLIAGCGESAPDLIDSDGITYEVKSNYREKGSVSSLHKANRLIDCDKSHIVIYFVYDNKPDFRAALYRFPNVIPELTYYHAINDDILALIKSGILVPKIEELLNKEGFIWTK